MKNMMLYIFKTFLVKEKGQSHVKDEYKILANDGFIELKNSVLIMVLASVYVSKTLFNHTAVYPMLEFIVTSGVPGWVDVDSETHQTQKDTEKLDHICVCDRVESSNKCVEDSYQS